MNPTWRLYKSKVMKTLNPEYEDDLADEVREVEEDAMSPTQQDEGQNSVFQLARKMQGASAKSWNRLSTLFNKDDEHQLLQEPESPPVADHPLAVKPEVPPRPSKGRNAFWDSFASNWAAKKQAEAEAAAQKAAEENHAGTPESEEADQIEEGASPGPLEEAEMDGVKEEAEPQENANHGFSKYTTLGGHDASFKWNFVTSKLAELRRTAPADGD
ncbi:uncharacterized protein C1orf232 [Stigmatopora nigra]